MILISVGITYGAEKKELLQIELPQQSIPDPQLFCGYCHILTYPDIIQKGHETWKKDKHNRFGCVECHYPPQKENIPKKIHLGKP